MKRRLGWHPEDIKAAVRKTGTTLTKLALDNGLSESVCRRALIKGGQGCRVIATYLGLNPHDLWPQWYDQHGNRLRFRSKADRIPKTTPNHRQNGRAA